MDSGFPLPDFDFDNAPLVPIVQQYPLFAQTGVPSDFANYCRRLGMIIDMDNPIRSTGNSVVYSATLTDGSGGCALKMSKHKPRIYEEYTKRSYLPYSDYLVQSFQVFESSQIACLQMELCSEGDLTGKLLNETEIWKLIHDIGCALDVVHKSGWIHLDVSPSNVLCDGERFKLTDFGTLTQYGKYASGMEGAGPYVSPETMSFTNYGENPIEVGYPTDIFSFGIVLMELASGYLAPRGGDEKYASLRSGKIVLGGELYKCSLGSELIDLVNSMLSPDQYARPTAEQIKTHPYALKAAAL